MRKYLSCGEFSICIEGCQRLLDCFQFQAAYRLSVDNPTPDVIVHLIEGLSDKMEDHTETWFVKTCDSVSEAVYYSKRSPAFSLSYDESLQNITVKVRNCIDSFLRIGIQYGILLALHRKCIGLHGATLLCGNEIVILSAPSGTGKTTLAHLLEKYCDAILINGDFALLSPTEEGVLFEPTPFCGSSKRCLNHRLRVNRVVFLGQSKTNVWCDLNVMQAIKHFMSNSFVPIWNGNMRNAVQENIMKCVSSLKLNSFFFAPTNEAAAFFFEHLNYNEGLSS